MGQSQCGRGLGHLSSLRRLCWHSRCQRRRSPRGQRVNRLINWLTSLSCWRFVHCFTRGCCRTRGTRYPCSSAWCGVRSWCRNLHRAPCFCCRNRRVIGPEEPAQCHRGHNGYFGRKEFPQLPAHGARNQGLVELRFQAQPGAKGERRRFGFRWVKPSKRVIYIVIGPHGELLKE